MRVVTAIAFYLIYWLICFLSTGSDKKKLYGLRSYPEVVQKKVRSDAELGRLVPPDKPIISIVLSNLILFTAVFSALGLALKSILGLDDYKTAFIFFLILGEGLGLFDFIVIDLLWRRESERIRFSFIPDKACYQNADKHIASFLRGIPLFAVVALLSAAVVTLL